MTPFPVDRYSKQKTHAAHSSNHHFYLIKDHLPSVLKNLVLNMYQDNKLNKVYKSVRKTIYSVAEGWKSVIFMWNDIGIFKHWSRTSSLFAGNYFSSCSAIPVFDNKGISHNQIHYDHYCSWQSGACHHESLKTSTSYVENSDSDT